MISRTYCTTMADLQGLIWCWVTLCTTLPSYITDLKAQHKAFMCRLYVWYGLSQHKLMCVMRIRKVPRASVSMHIRLLMTSTKSVASRQSSLGSSDCMVQDGIQAKSVCALHGSNIAALMRRSSVLQDIGQSLNPAM